MRALALTAAIAFATFVKVFGIGLLGRMDRTSGSVPIGTSLAVGVLGSLVLALAVGMPVWLKSLEACRRTRVCDRGGRKDACRSAAGACHGHQFG